MLILLLSAAGFAVSLYGLYIEFKLKKDASYKPACDISDKASCTKPMLSEYGRIFGVSNTVLGLIYYAVIFSAAMLGLAKMLFLFSVIGCLVSLAFAYILYFKIKSFCLICNATYVINGALLFASYYNL